VKQGLSIRDEIVESFLDHAPYNQVVDRIVAMYQDVSKRDDVPVVTDMLEDARLVTSDAIQCLPHWANTSSFIEKDPFLEYPFLEEWIAKAGDCNEIDLTTEHVFELVEKAEKPLRRVGRRISKLNK
jgi:hypothetical protein